MSAVARGTTNPPSIVGLDFMYGHIGPFGDQISGGPGAGENLKALDFCYVDSNGAVMRALEDQTGTTAAVNDVQTMASTLSAADTIANVSGGGYVLGYKGQYTPMQAYNAVYGTINTALQALSTVGAGNIVVTGTFPNFVFTAASAFAGVELELIEVQSSLIDLIDPTPPVLSMVHTTPGQPVGASGAEQAQSRVFGVCATDHKRGEPVSLFHSVIAQYSDGLLTPGADYFLSGTVPGRLDTARTLAVGVQFPVARAMDTLRLFILPIR